MRKILILLFTLLLGAPAYGQDVHIMWRCGTTGFAQFCQVEAANPLPVTGTFTPAGTQNVNLTQILSAAPSLTNPLWVFPATGATFPVSGTVAISGTVAVTQSTSPWVVAGSGTAGTANAGVVTVQGIASMTPVQVSQATAASLNATVIGAGTAGTANAGVITIQGIASMTAVQVTLPTTPLIASGSGVVDTLTTEASQATTTIATSALAANLVVNAAATNLYSFEVAADSTLYAAAWWIMIYNATSAPTDGAVTPAKCYAMPVGATSFAAAFTKPVRFSTGVTIGVSTNGCFTKAASTHAFISADYK